MRIVVVGATGNAGTSLLEALLRRVNVEGSSRVLAAVAAAGVPDAAAQAGNRGAEIAAGVGGRPVSGTSRLLRPGGIL